MGVIDFIFSFLSLFFLTVAFNIPDLVGSGANLTFWGRMEAMMMMIIMKIYA